MEKLNFVVFAILISANILICTAFFTDDSINVSKAVKFYNSIPGLSWKAGRNELGRVIKLSQIKSKLGWIPSEKKTQYEASHDEDNDDTDDDLPKNYDCRTAYPHCTTIRSIKDQSNCGSCWAVSVASVFSDRLCIHSKGKVNYNMSAEQLLACDKESNGCNGGHLDTSWKYITEHGLVTGGDYGSNEGCWPYSIPPNHSLFAPKPKTPECREVKCPQLYKAKKDSTAAMKSDEYKIRKEILKNGPLSTGFIVYLSFQFYSEGIYSKFFIDLPLGGHAVRIIGWGIEDGVKYWLVANSWGKDWGERGTFRILRGTNECDFEANAIAALPVY